MRKKILLKRTCLIMLLSMIWLSISAQKRIEGNVVDVSGEPLVGVSISAGSGIGTVTDANGNFTLNNLKTSTNLTVSYIGFVTQNVSVGNKTTLSIVMQPDKKELEEVVVVGYGTVKKRDLTGSVSSIKQEDIVAIPTTNALEALQGKVAGIDMNKTSGQAGSGVSYTIRGNRSLNASNAPLILVDGMPYGSDIDLDPNMIESIDILKDASSTAIYGSRGANGVIIITTKQGKEGKAHVSYNGYYSFDSAWDYPELQNTAQYADMVRESYRSIGQWKSTDDDYKVFMGSYDFIKNNTNVDWVNLVLKNGSTNSHSVNVNYGNDRTQVAASVQFQKQDGEQLNDEMKRYTGTLSLGQKIGNNWKILASAIIAHTDQNKGSDAFNVAIKTAPYGTPYNEDGTINIYPYGDGQTISPLAETIDGNYQNNTRSYRAFASGGVEWTPIKNLLVKSTFSANITNNRNGQYYGSYTTKQGGGYSYAYASNTQANNWIWENTANYNLTMKKHDLNFMLGSELQKNITEYYYGEGKDLLSESMGFYNLESTQVQQQVQSQYTKTSMISYFGRINYKFNERYLLTATLRADGSSVLAKGHKWGWFPSLAGAWRMGEEEFMAPTKDWLSNLKLRASWGVSGNSAVSAYQTQGGLGQTMYVFDVNGSEVGQYGYWPTSISNNQLSWEKTAATDIGVDAGFFNGRINLTFDWYQQKTYDLLMQKQIPVTNGYSSTWANVGKTKNTGFEIVLNTQNIVSKDFNWSTDITFTHNHEEIVELADGSDRDLANGWFVGQPINVNYTVKKLGIWQTSEAETAATFGQIPGQVKNQDINDDKKIDSNDRMIIGTPRPDFIMGMNNKIKIGNFDFSAFLYWRHGSQFQLSNFYNIQGNVRCYSYVDFWTPENPTNAFPRPNRNAASSDISLSGLSYESGSFLKVRDITMGYTLPKSVTRSINIENARLYCTLKNFFQFNSLSLDGYDAERGGGYGFPTIKQLVIGINVDI